MGGIGSGRWPGTPTIESTGSLILDVNQVMRALGGSERGTLALTGRIGARPHRIELAIDLADNQAGIMRVQHASISLATTDRGPQDYTVVLTATPCPFGGRRWWFVCPRTGERVGKLYLPNGGQRFLSRDAYRLGYRSQRICPADRVHIRLTKLHQKLGAEYVGMSPGIPARPRGMRQRTYTDILIDIIVARRELARLFEPDL